jgi:hypothetical protein
LKHSLNSPDRSFFPYRRITVGHWLLNPVMRQIPAIANHCIEKTRNSVSTGGGFPSFATLLFMNSSAEIVSTPNSPCGGNHCLNTRRVAYGYSSASMIYEL